MALSSKIRVLTLFLCATTVLPARAEEPLSWNDLVAETARRNASLIVSKEAANKSEAQLTGSYATLLPKLSGNVGYDRSGGTSSLSTSTGDNYTFGVTSSINLFNGFQDSARIDQAKATWESNKAAVDGQKATVHFELKKAYAQLLYAQRALELSKEIEKRRRGNFELVEMRFQGGRENKGSFLRVKASHRLAEFDISQGERNLVVAQRQLSRVLGRDLNSPIAVKGDLNTKPHSVKSDEFSGMVGDIPVVRQSRFDHEAAEEGVTKAYGTFYPSLDLTGSVFRNGTTFPPNSDRWSIGATITIPIFNWGNFYEVSAARSEERRTDANVRNQSELARVKLEETHATLENAIEKVGVQNQVYTAASVRSEIARNQYSAGIITYNEWDIIENDLISQQQNLLGANRDAVLAEAAWEQALGKGDLP